MARNDSLVVERFLSMQRVIDRKRHALFVFFLLSALNLTFYVILFIAHTFYHITSSKTINFYLPIIVIVTFIYVLYC